MQKALYFIPDISGFTRFVNETEIEHSIHIIEELLETLLDNNPLEFKLAEIEGDALFMYSTEFPSFDQLMIQLGALKAPTFSASPIYF
jgi:predicted nucleic-acid-binding protein